MKPRDYHRDDYLEFQVNLLKCLGMWPIGFRNYLPSYLHWLSCVLNGIYFVLMSGNLGQMAVLQMKTLFDAWGGSLDDVSDYIISSIIYSGGFLMCIYYQIRYVTNKAMVDHLNASFLGRSPSGLTFVTMEKCYEYARKLSIYWAISCVRINLLTKKCIYK